MIPESHLVIGGIICSMIAIFGTVLNTIALVVLCSEKKLRRNPTTILIIFLSFSNLVSSVLALPLEALSLFNPTFFKENPLLCQSSAILFYGNYGVIIFTEATLAINRWAAVCTKNYRLYNLTMFANVGLGNHDHDQELQVHSRDIPGSRRVGVGPGTHPHLPGGQHHNYGMGREHRNLQLGRQHEEDGADGGDRGDALPRHMPLLCGHSLHPEVDILFEIT